MGFSFITRAIINDLDLILHGPILQIIYTTDFWAKRENNLTLHVASCDVLTERVKPLQGENFLY
jgi:hypothetical protein